MDMHHRLSMFPLLTQPHTSVYQWSIGYTGATQAAAVTTPPPSSMLADHAHSADCVQEEEEYLMDLMYEEEMAERKRQAEMAAAAKREAAKQEMMAANAGDTGQGTMVRPAHGCFTENPNVQCHVQFRHTKHLA